jgi:hypothetical protein
MSTESPKNDPRDDEVPCRLLDVAEFDFSAATPPEPGVPVGGLEICATVQEQTEIDCTEAVSTGPAVALRLTVRLAPGADPGICTRQFVELLHALNDLDLALGGRGLVLDQSLSAASGGLMTVVLRPLDVRWSLDRFRQMAALLGGLAEAQPGEEPSAPTDNGRIAEVISLYEGWTGAATESPRDRVQGWRGRRQWLAGLQVELVYRRAS